MDLNYVKKVADTLGQQIIAVFIPTFLLLNLRKMSVVFEQK